MRKLILKTFFKYYYQFSTAYFRYQRSKEEAELISIISNIYSMCVCVCKFLRHKNNKSKTNDK